MHQLNSLAFILCAVIKLFIVISLSSLAELAGATASLWVKQPPAAERASPAVTAQSNVSAEAFRKQVNEQNQQVQDKLTEKWQQTFSQQLPPNSDATNESVDPLLQKRGANPPAKQMVEIPQQLEKLDKHPPQPENAQSNPLPTHGGVWHIPY